MTSVSRFAGTKPEWLTPDWPAPSNVRAVSTLRAGGLSTAPYASLNLGSHVADSDDAVRANRQALRAAARLPEEPVWLAQVHGIDVALLDASADARADSAKTPSADAAVTRRPGRVCVILTADCLPVLLASVAGDCVGAAHAGWRGLAGGVIEATVGAMRVPPEGLMAWLGPAIGADHFEVGEEVRAAFVAGDAAAAAAFQANSRGRFMADLYALARRRLTRLGVTRVYGGGLCTYAEPDRYFSHRRDGVTGRQATLIWLDGPPPR